MAAQSGRKSAIAVLPDYLFARDNDVVYILYIDTLFQYFLRLKLNQEVLVKMENTNPVIFNNVQVWAAKAAYNFPPADAYIRDLSYVNLGNYCR